MTDPDPDPEPDRRDPGAHHAPQGSGSVIAGVDLDLVRVWLDEAGVEGHEITDVEPLTGGTQNILLRFRRGGRDLVLRRPPLHKRHNSDETMRREARVLAALRDTDVPHPRLVAACADTEVIGAAFTVMEAVDGANPTVALPTPYVEERRWRWELGLAVADGAAAIGAVDVAAGGLADLGRSDGFLDRQVPRWIAQLDSYSDADGYEGHALPLVEPVAEWLAASQPTSWQPGLMHGDYHLANVLCRRDRPALAAIVDWELTTIGDPLLDLGWLLATWPDDDQSLNVHHAIEPWDGFPGPDDLVARYAERTTRDLSNLRWYEVLACFKLSILLEGTHARAVAGAAPVAIGERFHLIAIRLLEKATRRIQEV